MTQGPPSGGNPPGGDPGGSQPPQPPQYADTPAGRAQARFDQAQLAAQQHGQPQQPAQQQQDPQQNGPPQHVRRNNGMKSGTKILGGLVLAALILALALIAAVALLIWYFSPPAIAGGGAPTASASAFVPPPVATNQVPTGMPSPTLSEDDANKTRECNSTMVGKGAGRWYMVYTSLDSHVTLASRLCVGPGIKFRTAETARVVARTVYIREGGHEASGTVDTKYKLSDFAPGKAYANVLDSTKGSEKSYNFENPYIVFIDEGNAFDFCDQYKDMKTPPKDDLVAREIWSRCKLGGTHNKAVAQSIANWASREDMAALQADMHKVKAKMADIDTQVTQNGDVTLPPKEVGYNPSGPSK